MPALNPLNEEQRLQALRDYRIMDTDPEEAFDDAVHIASHICQTPIALVSLVDETRQWFKARVGLKVQETSRELAFCAHAILDDEPMVVPDASRDERFADNPLVTGDPRIRFYAGAPLTTPSGLNLGTLCVIDRKPRQLAGDQLCALSALARQTVRLLEHRKLAERLASALERARTLSGLIPICSFCRRIRDDGDYWSQVEDYIAHHTGSVMTHGICPSCDEALEQQERSLTPRSP